MPLAATLANLALVSPRASSGRPTPPVVVLPPIRLEARLALSVAARAGVVRLVGTRADLHLLVRSQGSRGVLSTVVGVTLRFHGGARLVARELTAEALALHGDDEVLLIALLLGGTRLR